MKKTILLLSNLILTAILHGQVVCNGQQVVLLEDGECNYNPYTLVFEDNFDGGALDLTKWIPITGVVRDPSHNIEQQWYTPNNIEVSNGTLKLITKAETLNNQCSDLRINNRMQTLCQNFNYTSAEIDSKYKFEHGKFATRCKLINGRGYFPVFWTYGGLGWY